MSGRFFGSQNHFQKDNFYMKLPGLDRPDSLMWFSFTIAGDFLYIAEVDEEGVYTIGKYKIGLLP